MTYLPASSRVVERPKPRLEKPLTLPQLHEALSEALFSARYQPIVRLRDHSPVGLEVLARLEHPTRGTLMPDLFVPPIEDAGLAWPLTKAVIRRAFVDWNESGLSRLGVWLALNFTIEVLLDARALDWLEEQRRNAGIPADCLTIELTESRPVTRIPELHAAVDRLRELGYGVAIDDVGPEIRDHRALLDMPFTILKLDKSAVCESGGRAASGFLTRTIAEARNAEFSIVAEGVEDHGTWARMKDLAVDYAQGFMIARPLPVVGVLAWQREWCGRHAAGAPAIGRAANVDGAD